MDYSENRFPRRRSTRVPGYDYRTPGIYFITFCTYRWRCTLSTVRDGRVRLRPLGRMVVAARDAESVLHHVVMPNHVHALVRVPPPADMTLPPSVSAVVADWKARVTARARVELGASVVWQRGFHDRIVRNDRECSALWQYIDRNPGRWADDRFNGRA